MKKDHKDLVLIIIAAAGSYFGYLQLKKLQVGSGNAVAGKGGAGGSVTVQATKDYERAAII